MWLALTLAACCWNWRQVFVAGQVYFADPDCYSRMTRAQSVIAAPWKPIRFHDFENAPAGIVPHTTAPLDLLLAALAGAFHLGFRISGFHSPYPPLDLAGAFLSPLLGMTLVAFLWWWGRRLALPNRNAVLAIASISPIVAHGFELGRPDHQSLIILLIGAALATEIALWKRPSRAWEILSAALWALALWTSLFEPLILLATTALMRLGVLGGKAIPDRIAALVFLVLLIGAFLFDGWRVRAPSGEEKDYFFRWALNIGELRHATLSQLFYLDRLASDRGAFSAFVALWKVKRPFVRRAGRLVVSDDRSFPMAHAMGIFSCDRLCSQPPLGPFGHPVETRRMACLWNFPLAHGRRVGPPTLPG